MKRPHIDEIYDSWIRSFKEHTFPKYEELNPLQKLALKKLEEYKNMVQLNLTKEELLLVQDLVHSAYLDGLRGLKYADILDRIQSAFEDSKEELNVPRS